MKTLKTKSRCAQECWWSGTLGFYWCLHSSLTPTRLWNVYRQWASKKTVIMLLGFSVSKSVLALCVPNHINYLSGCRDPPLGICCTSLPEHPGRVAVSLQREERVLVCAGVAYGGPGGAGKQWWPGCFLLTCPLSGGKQPALGRMTPVPHNRQKGSFSGRLIVWTHSSLGRWSSGCTCLLDWGLNHFYGSSFLSDLAYQALTRKLQSSAQFWIDKLKVGSGNLAFSPVTSLTSPTPSILSVRIHDGSTSCRACCPDTSRDRWTGCCAFSVTRWWNQQIHGAVLGEGGSLEGGCLADLPPKNQITSTEASEIGSTVRLLRDLGPRGLPK